MEGLEGLEQVWDVVMEAYLAAIEEEEREEAAAERERQEEAGRWQAALARGRSGRCEFEDMWVGGQAAHTGMMIGRVLGCGDQVVWDDDEERPGWLVAAHGEGRLVLRWVEVMEQRWVKRVCRGARGTAQREQAGGTQMREQQPQLLLQQEGSSEAKVVSASVSNSISINNVMSSGQVHVNMVTTPMGVEYDGQPFGCAPLGQAM